MQDSCPPNRYVSSGTVHFLKKNMIHHFRMSEKGSLYLEIQLVHLKMGGPQWYKEDAVRRKSPLFSFQSNREKNILECDVNTHYLASRLTCVFSTEGLFILAVFKKMYQHKMWQTWSKDIKSDILCWSHENKVHGLSLRWLIVSVLVTWAIFPPMPKKTSYN